jgi:hypothetical protein
MFQLLPDRERRHLLQFYLFSQWSYHVRLAWAGGLIVAGLLIQLLWLPTTPIPTLLLTLPLLLMGTMLLLVQGFNLKPTGQLHGGEWEKTTRDRFRQVCKLESDVKQWDEVLTDITCVSGVVIFALIAGTVAILWMIMQSQYALRTAATPLALDAAVLILPHWCTGTRRGWRPVALRQQIDSLEIALKSIETFEDPPCQIQPMFEMAGSNDKRTPVGARAFVRFPDGPEEFLGLQFQVALNDVQGTKYPYLYVVLIAKKSFQLLEKRLAKIRVTLVPKQEGSTGFLGLFTSEPAGRLTVESSSENDVDVIIIRQHTTKKSGYHTDPTACRRIARAAWSSVAEIV